MHAHTHKHTHAHAHTINRNTKQPEKAVCFDPLAKQENERRAAKKRADQNNNHEQIKIEDHNN